MIRNILHLLPILIVLGLICVSTPASADEMRVKDLPIPEGATDATYMKRRGDVRCQVNSDFKTVGQYYATVLAEQQWSKSKKDNLQRNFWVQTFAKGNLSLVVRVSSEKKGCEVRLTPTGMMWEEDDQPTPKDLPIPDEATDIKYDDFFESVEFQSPSKVKSVAETLSTELEKRKWTKTSTSFDLDDLVMMKFTFQKSSIDVDIRGKDAGCKVGIRTKGMQWDGMKAEIAKAKKKAAKAAEIAEASPREAETVDAQYKLPKRKDRPKQGIAKLPKLSSEGTVVMDGTTHKLTHVMAYEVYEHDEWSTKIVATQKPIKQLSLLARLKKTGTDLDENEFPPDWPQPYLLIELDENNKPRRLSLRADGTPGGGMHNELIGTALVEDGRARGTVGLKEPDSFFEKEYTGELTFDVPVLTRDSKPAKQLDGASKLANSGKLKIGAKTYNLTNVVAYETKFFDEPMTTIVLSEKPLNMAKLKTALGRKAADDYFEFTPQVKLLIDVDDNIDSVNIWADNMSVGSNNNLADEVVIEDGRARGTARMTKPDEFMDREYSFEVSFDVNVLGKPVTKRKTPASALTADSYDGFPVPEGHKGMHSQGSPFRTETGTSVVANLSTVVDFYRNEMTSGEWGEWQESAADAKIEQQAAKLAFKGPNGALLVQLQAKGNQTEITLVSRDAKAAKAAGLLPGPGKARLFIANESGNETVITINKQKYKVAAGAGAKDPKTGLNWEVAPGTFIVGITPPGQAVQTETMKLGAGETWGVIIGRSGEYMAAQLY